MKREDRLEVALENFNANLNYGIIGKVGRYLTGQQPNSAAGTTTRVSYPGQRAPFVISTGAKRRGQTCSSLHRSRPGPLANPDEWLSKRQAAVKDRKSPPFWHLDRAKRSREICSSLHPSQSGSVTNLDEWLSKPRAATSDNAESRRATLKANSHCIRDCSNLVLHCTVWRDEALHAGRTPSRQVSVISGSVDCGLRPNVRRTGPNQDNPTVRFVSRHASA
jgi:hypothetical protein